MQALALVDYDNCRTRTAGSVADLELDTLRIIDRVTNPLALSFPRMREVDVRLYGGWTDLAGLPTPDAWALLGLLPNLRGRRHGMIVRPSLAVSMIEYPHLLLRGTLRGQGKSRRQKMVDGMMGCDAAFVARQGDTLVLLTTDDDDILPSVLAAYASNKEMTVWIRAREVGSAINDARVLGMGVRVMQLGS